MAVEKISHKGRVVETTPEYITVEFIAESACDACHAKGLCSMGEATTKVVQVPATVSAFYETGEEVNVCLKASMGHKAVWLCYVVPLFVLMAALLGLLQVGVSELASGLAAIAAVAVYYFLIWLFRNQLRKEYVFYIEKLR